MNLKQISGFVAAPGGVLLLMFFFLPWISVSCSNTTIMEGSGFDLAQGFDEGNLSDDFLNQMGLSEDMLGEELGGEFSMDDFGETEIEDNPAAPEEEPSFNKAAPTLYLIPLVGLLVAGIAAYGFFDSRILNMWTALGGYILPSLLGGGVMLMKYLQLRDDQTLIEAQNAAQSTGGEADFGLTMQIVELNYELGWWLSILTLFLIFAAGAVLFLAVDEKPSRVMAAKEIKKPTTPEEIKAAFTQAKAHIQAKEYEQARAILHLIDHPTAQQWLAKVDELDPFGTIPD